MRVPWKIVKDWHCVACGKCCDEYVVPLKPYEYLKLKWSGFVEERFGRFYIKKVNGKCPFQYNRLCILQGELKPVACKLYPFVIRKKGDERAEFEYNGETFYVYVDTFCENVVLGRPSESLKRMIVEAIQIHLGVKKDVEKITCRNFFNAKKKVFA